MTTKHVFYQMSFPAASIEANGYPGGLTSYTVDRTFYPEVTRDATGANLPNWKQVIASGGSATNFFLLTGRVWPRGSQIPLVFNSSHQDYDSYLYTYKGFCYQSHYGHYDNMYSFKPGLRKNAIDAANIKVIKKIYDSRNSFNGFAFLGEIHKTLHSIRHPAEALSKLAQTYAQTVASNKASFAARKGYLARKGKLLKTVKQVSRHQRQYRRLLTEERRLASNLWLEYRFGVLPLIQDIQSYAETALDLYLGNQEKYRWYRASGTDVTQGIQYTSETYQNYGAYYRNDYTCTHTGRARIIAREKLTPIVPVKAISDLALQSLNLRNFGEALIPALWDLTPLSVFVDYFVNVNDVLVASLTELSNVDHVELQYRESKDFTVNTRFVSGARRGYTQYAHQDGQTFSSTFRYQREEWALTIPSVTFTSPIGSPIRLTNLLAFLNNVI